MYRLAIEYIELSSLRLVCIVVVLTVQEHWSEIGTTETQGSDYKVCSLIVSLSIFNSVNLGKEYHSALLCSRSRWI
jgi:hypothetical protein